MDRLFFYTIFVDARNHARTCMYKHAYFTVHRSSMKTTKIEPLENFPLYDNSIIPGVRELPEGWHI